MTRAEADSIKEQEKDFQFAGIDVIQVTRERRTEDGDISLLCHYPDEGRLSWECSYDECRRRIEKALRWWKQQHEQDECPE